ncbi:MAG: four helix bundle protein [Syntrophomonadaceae bacterium]|nr:four helix bundle protein [Syntrophomonadaceae bacterium]
MRSHHRLEAWQEAMRLVKQVYSVTNSFPKEEVYGLTNQMRRCAISIPSNIAEGAARDSNLEFVRFLTIARGSLSELETQLLIARDLGYTSDEKILTQVDRVFALIGGLIKSIKKKI